MRRAVRVTRGSKSIGSGKLRYPLGRGGGQLVGVGLGLEVTIQHLTDPRVEQQEHYYNAKHSKLLDLGLQPHFLSESLLDSLVNIAVEYRGRVDESLFMPRVDWRRARNDRRTAPTSRAIPLHDTKSSR